MTEDSATQQVTLAGQPKGEGRSLGAFLRAFCIDTSAAIAATYALSMFVLVAIAGVAWDWTRMTAMDSELQNAADQAALAAATQLDGKVDAIDRATLAASNLVRNGSLMSNDGGTYDLAVQSLVFFDGYNQTTDTFGPVTTDDDDARAVTVTIAPREAVYTMTPVVGLIRSGEVIAQASATLGSAICNTPPVMLCNPLEDDGLDFNPANYIGRGLKLITDNDNGAPGNFGFLANGDATGAANLAAALGYDDPPGNCVPGNGVTTEPGLKDVVFNALNTRFDISVNGANTCPGGAANCTAAPISRKNLVKKTTNGANCGITGQGWQQPAVGTRYIAPFDATTQQARMMNSGERAAVKVIGHPRDLCHAWSEAGNCAVDSYGVIGTGTWDRDAFFQVNYPTVGAWSTVVPDADGNGIITRYEVYLWETERYFAGQLTNAEKHQSDGSNWATATPICRGEGTAARRTITAAVINCQAEGVQGRTPDVDVAHWVELFLVEPSFTRRVAGSSSAKLTDANDVYVEVVRAVDVGGDGSTGEVVRRDVPYLIR
ncbi:pilus assembly protein TadG-related protein [Qipengyuania sp. CAU 1752]